MFEGFRTHRIDSQGVAIHAVVGGEARRCCCCTGHPQTHVIWHKVAGELARHFTVVATICAAMATATSPPACPDHANYSKRTMAADQMAVMRSLGFERFRVLAHDRGGRVAHRLALDHPQAVEKLVTLDIAPTLAMYAQTSKPSRAPTGTGSS